MRQAILIHAHHERGQRNALASQLRVDDFVIRVNGDAGSPIDAGGPHPAARPVAPRAANPRRLRDSREP